MDINIYLPPVADEIEQLYFGLITLTEAIAQIANDSVAHGCLGGEFGYGAKYENDVFMMHPYCWCDSEECEWCNGEAPNFLHKQSGLSVHWYKWIGRSMNVKNDTGIDISTVMRECVASLTITLSDA